MTKRALTALLSLTFTVACGDDTSDFDAGFFGMDGSAEDGGGMDTGADDAGTDVFVATADAAADAGPTPEPWRPEFVGVDSSWETGTGSGDTAVLDGRWDGVHDRNFELLTVVDAASEGVDAIDGNNVMRMGVDGESDRMMIEDNAFDTAGDCRYTRMYQYVACIDTNIAQIHHFEDWDDAGSTRFIHRLYDYQAGDGRWTISAQSYADQERNDPFCPGQGDNSPGGLFSLRHPDTTSPADEHDPNGLSCGQWYRIESQECCIEGDEGCWDTGLDEALPVQARLRVYDSSGAQVFGENDSYTQHRAGEFGSFSMEENYDAGACWMVESAPDLALGNNGQQGITAAESALMYWDAVLTGSSDDRREGANPWIGPCEGEGCF